MTVDRSRLSLSTGARRLAPLLLGLALFAVLMGLARAFDTFPGDKWALLEVVQLRTGWLDDAAMFVTSVGQGGIGWGVAVPWVPAATVSVALAARRWGDAAFLAAAVLAPVVNLGLKELAARPRPDADLWLVLETGHGFPSGHAVFAASFFGALAWLAGRWVAFDSRPGLRRTTQAALLLLILAVGFSRVYLGVHWPSDVVAGFLFAGIFLGALIVVRREIEIRRRCSTS